MVLVCGKNVNVELLVAAEKVRGTGDRFNTVVFGGCWAQGFVVFARKMRK